MLFYSNSYRPFCHPLTGDSSFLRVEQRNLPPGGHQRKLLRLAFRGNGERTALSAYGWLPLGRSPAVLPVPKACH